MDTAKEYAETGAEAAQDTFEQGKQAVKRFARQAKDTAGEYANKAGQYAKQAKDATEEQIYEKPWQSMLVAMGVGACIGLALGWLVTSRED